MTHAKYIVNPFDEEEALMIAKRKRREIAIKKAEQLQKERLLGEQGLLIERYIHYLAWLLGLAGMIVIGLLFLVMFLV